MTWKIEEFFALMAMYNLENFGIFLFNCCIFWKIYVEIDTRHDN